MKDRDEIVRLLESLLPYVEYAAAQDIPNAAHYVEVLRSLIWRDKV